MKKAWYWVFFVLSAALPFGLYHATEYLDYVRSRTFDFRYFWCVVLCLIVFGVVLGIFHCLHTQVGKWYGSLLLLVVYAAYMALMFTVPGSYLYNAYTVPAVSVTCGLLVAETVRSILLEARKKMR